MGGRWVRDGVTVGGPPVTWSNVRRDRAGGIGARWGCRGGNSVTVGGPSGTGLDGRRDREGAIGARWGCDGRWGREGVIDVGWGRKVFAGEKFPPRFLLTGPCVTHVHYE